MHKVSWTVSIPRSFFHQIKIYCSLKEPAKYSIERQRKMTSFAVLQTDNNAATKLFNCHKKSQKETIAFNSYFNVYFACILFSFRGTTWKFNHEKQSIRIGICIHTLPIFFSLSLNPYLLNFSHSMAQNYSDYWALFFLYSHSLTFWMSLVLVYGSLIFNAACNRMTFCTRLWECSVNRTMTLNVNLNTAATVVHRLSNCREWDRKRGKKKEKCLPVECSTFIGS